ncbi:MAG TPA: aryl-sulfate sulfotransferase [Cyclobacteriaceae bacterium]|nr:aryl-sulfate sulfotransferase [Cyclobacteriaceae bacterium]
MRRLAKLSLWFCVAFLAWRCSENFEGTREQLTLTEIKLALATAYATTDLIKSIDSTSGSYLVSFEQQAPIDIPERMVEEVIIDSARWLATFVFKDQSQQPTNFIGELKIGHDDVSVNPYLTCPLTALATFTTPVEGRFRIIVKGKDPSGISIAKEFHQVSNKHRLPILGLYEDHMNEVEFAFLDALGNLRCSKTMLLRTGPLQNKPQLEIEVLQNSLPADYGGLYVVSNICAGFDQATELRWIYSSERGGFFGKLRNGNFAVADFDQTKFYEVTVLGQLVRTYVVPNRLHHEIYEMPNGNFLAATYSPPGPPLEDRLVEISRESGTVVKEWDLNTILDPSRVTLPDCQPSDWLHINAAYYDENDNSIVISGRSQCVVVKFDYQTGAIRWILANPNGWGPSFTPYLLKPVDLKGNSIDVASTDFWSYGQHSIHRTPDGNLLMYDNGDYRGFYDTPLAPRESYSRIVEYKINEQDMTVELVWEFNNNKAVFTRFTGSTQFLNETRLAGYASMSENTPRVAEVTKDNDVVYEATINRGKASYYRIQKVDIYAGVGE